MEPFELTAERLEQLVHEFRGEVDTGWIDGCLDEIDSGRSPDDYGEGRLLLEALRDLPETLDALQNEYPPPNPAHVPILGSIAFVVAHADELEGSAELFQVLQEEAARQSAGGFRQFRNYLFEAEVAVYCQQAGAVSVRFDPDYRPDVWITGSGGRDIPVECKRLWQSGREQTRFQRLRDNLLTAYGQLETSVEASEVGSGIAAVKIREPESRQELWDADAVVRDTLSRHRHVGFVSLFWHRSHGHSGPLLYGPDEIPRRTRIEAYTLAEYRIPHTLPEETLTVHDSRITNFPDGPPEPASPN